MFPFRSRPRTVKHCAEGHVMDKAWRTCPSCTGAPAQLLSSRGDFDRTVFGEQPRLADEPSLAPPSSSARRPEPHGRPPAAPAPQPPVTSAAYAPPPSAPLPLAPPLAPPALQAPVPPGLGQFVWVLVGTEGAARDLRIELAGALIKIGKAPRAEVGATIHALDDPYLSREHIVIGPRADRWLLRDAGSRNGTAVNEERVEEHLLAEGDVVKAGRLAFRVERAERGAPA